jgi:hypothetical protein
VTRVIPAALNRYRRNDAIFPQPESIIMTQFSFQRGETIALALDALTGDPALVSSISAVMKAVAPGRSHPAPGAPVAATFSAALRAADGTIPAGWTLTIPAQISAGLAPGPYVADARLTLPNGDITISDSITLQLRPSVSA